MRFRLLSLLVPLLAAATAARADDNACWNRDTTLVDIFTTTPEGGDNQFFTSVAQKGNVSLVFPTAKSMVELPVSLYEIRHDLGGATPTGCTNAFLNNLPYFMPAELPTQLSLNGSAVPAIWQGKYNPIAHPAYPDPEVYYATKQGANTPPSNIAPASAYLYLDWPNNSGSGNPQLPLTACIAATADPFQQLACNTCVGTKGYWLNPAVAENNATTKAGVFSGNFLRFYPPKFLMLKLAYRLLVDGPLLSTLRQANLTMSGTNGASLNQKYLPSCNGNGRPMNQISNALTGVAFNNTANPIAESLFNAAYYNSDGTSFFGGPGAYFANSAVQWPPGSGGVCPGCNQNFVVLLSDGRGDTGNAFCVPNGLGVLPGPCLAAAQCSTLGLGTEDDGNDYINPSWLGSVTGPSPVRKTPGGTCDMDFADDIAHFMSNNDMVKSTPGSTVVTFVVGIGSNTYNRLTSLQEVALAGKGSFAQASDFQSLGEGLVSIFQQIITRSTSFSVAAITTVQTRGSTFAFVPRFKPQQGPQWGGKLFRFKLFNEFSAGCTSVNYGVVSATNPNGDSNCNDVYLKDGDNDFIGEDTDGNFVKLDNAQTYQPPPATNPWPARSPTVLANPVWEASDVLYKRASLLDGSGQPTVPRTVFTVRSSTGGGGGYDTRVDFTVANAATLTPLLALQGFDSTFCTQLQARARHVYTTEQDCATDVIKYMLGFDILFENPANQTTPAPLVLKPRVNILGDIFHSSPVLVTPPSPTFLCDLGIVNQCVFSLYAPNLTPGGQTAYASYLTTNQYRTQMLLVGANDGMLHAFEVGNDTTGDDPETSIVEPPGTHYYTLGSGKEMWAFIPPDLLPKLQYYILGQRHETYVDGTPMVRDIWVDGSGPSSGAADKIKQADEFHTIAIVGEREGGHRYFALDVTDPSNPTYKWTWPKTGSSQDLDQGQTWNDHSPAPPPIGAIAVDDPFGPFPINGVKASEKYIVAVGGGYDFNLQRGRGVFMIDAWTGTEVFRFARIDSTGGGDPRNRLWPVAATPTLLDTDADGLFDALVVGDVRGQVWTIDMKIPGKDTTGDGRFDNWFGARAFTQFKTQAEALRSPFFQVAGAVQQSSGDIRILIGGGDRSQIRGVNGGTCGLADLRACIRKGCAVDLTNNKYDIGSKYEHGEWQVTSNGVGQAKNNLSIDGASDGASCTDALTVDQSYAITCGALSTTYNNKLFCDWGVSLPGVDCPDLSGKPLFTNAEPTNYVPSQALQPARFYSIQLFDSANRKRFGGSANAGTNQTDSNTYDSNVLTDTNLDDVTLATASSNNTKGWFVQYPVTDEKTASGTLILSGCAVWNTLVPQNNTVTCGSIPADKADLFHADPITGSTNCGNGLPAALASVRYTQRSAVVPPPMPTPVVAINPVTGAITYSGVSLEPGGQPLQISVGVNDLFGTINWLEVPRQTHICRHNGGNCLQ